MFDLIDLMRQAGAMPWPRGAGVETYVAGPANQDGIRLAQSCACETTKTHGLVMAMLDALFEPDRRAMGMQRFWAANMMWYGPG